MKLIPLVSIAGVLGLVAVFASLQIVGAQSKASDDSGGTPADLQCTLDAQKDYLFQSPAVAPVTASPSLAFMGPERADILEGLAVLDLPEGTSFVVAHEPSAELFVKTCAAEKCTFEEFYEPDQACQRAHRGGCFYVAVRYQERTYCLLQEAD